MIFLAFDITDSYNRPTNLLSPVAYNFITSRTKTDDHIKQESPIVIVGHVTLITFLIYA